MIIKFSKNITLSEWTLNPQPDINRSPPSKNIWHRLYVTSENQHVIGVSVKELYNFLILPTDYKKSYAMFYHDLACLHDCFPPRIEGDLEFAKDYVDNFLIRMSGLTAFI